MYPPPPENPPRPVQINFNVEINRCYAPRDAPPRKPPRPPRKDILTEKDKNCKQKLPHNNVQSATLRLTNSNKTTAISRDSYKIVHLNCNLGEHCSNQRSAVAIEQRIEFGYFDQRV